MMNSLPMGRELAKKFWHQRYLMILTLPVVLWIIIFNYVPMYGIIIAFQEYTPFNGFMHSPWTGLANFNELFIGSELSGVTEEHHLKSVSPN